MAYFLLTIWIIFIKNRCYLDWNWKLSEFSPVFSPRRIMTGLSELQLKRFPNFVLKVMLFFVILKTMDQEKFFFDSTFSQSWIKNLSWSWIMWCIILISLYQKPRSNEVPQNFFNSLWNFIIITEINDFQWS